jgi:hypothetical protein
MSPSLDGLSLDAVEIVTVGRAARADGVVAAGGSFALARWAAVALADAGVDGTDGIDPDP